MQLKEKVIEINKPENRIEKERYVRRLFDAIAPGYDKMNALMSFGLHHSWRKRAIGEMGMYPGARVLDGCAGTCDFAVSSAHVVGDKGSVIAFDFSQQMLCQAHDKLPARKVDKIIKLNVADATCLPYKNESFHFATVGWGIRNLSNIRQGLGEMYRVLKPGGKFACLDLGRPVNPIFARIYYFCFFHVVPKIGKLITGNEEAYAYLPNSLHTFPKQEELKEMLEDASFINVRYINLMGGAMAIHIGEKPEIECVKIKP